MKKYFFLAIIFILSSCAYYNTFFNAKKHFKEAFEKQKTIKIQGKRLPADIIKHYSAAIDKSCKLINNYGDSSQYADDALLLIGKCHYNLREYMQAERVLGQFILKYPESEFIPEAKLWLAKSYISNKKEKDALELLDELLSGEVDRKIAVQGFYILGSLHYQKEEYDTALKYLEKAINIAKEDELLGNAYYLEGEIYFKQKKYNAAAEQFDRLRDLDIPILKEYEAQMRQVDALIALKDFSSAESLLKQMLRDIRFNKQFSVIETKLGNLSEIQGDTEYARDLYYDILSKYKNDEGVSLSAYFLAQIYEFNDGNFDSAKVYYAKVRNLKTHDDILNDSKERIKLVKEYLKIRDQLRKDKRDLFALAQGDSSLEDSMVVAPDSLEIQRDETFVKEEFSEAFSMSNKEKEALRDSLAKKEKEKKKKVKKIVVSRTPDQVKKSYKKFSFNIAEFFLLKYQNYDSAAAAYKTYISVFPQDTILVPKALYSLYFIYQDLETDSLKADSLKALLVRQYPDSPYGLKLRGVRQKKEKTAPTQETVFIQQYRNAENLLEERKYQKALFILKKIAVQDSGSVWAQKSRYAIAYTYEHFLDDIPRAVEAYRVLKKEYPKSKYAKIAQNKIKKPPKEILPESEPKNEIKTEKKNNPQNKIQNRQTPKKRTTEADSIHKINKILEEE